MLAEGEVWGGEEREGELTYRQTYRHTYRHTDMQTYRPSDEAGPRGAFAPNNRPPGHFETLTVIYIYSVFHNL